MFTAERFFEQANEANFHSQRAEAAAQAKSQDVKTLSDIEYTTYVFNDRSQLTMGSNGYVGCELPSE